MKYAEFLNTVADSRLDICRAAFFKNREKIKIKKERTVVRNLEKIFEATLKIGIRKGFQAMTMRDLSRASGLSMGAIYSYFAGKDDILKALLSEGRKVVWLVLRQFLENVTDPLEKLNTAVEVHLFLSEKMHKLFYFSYMEARNLKREEKQKAIQSELYTEKMIADILVEGHQRGRFRRADHQLCASLIKAMLQDWYLKRGKYLKRKIDVDQYARCVKAFIQSFYVGGLHG